MKFINHTSHVPFYQQLKDRLLENIESGKLIPHQKIPTEKELETANNISRTTVRQALEELVLEGYLYRRQGVGTFVAEPKLEYALGKLTSFSEDIRRRGQEPGSRLTSLSLVAPARMVAHQLEISNSEEEKVLELIRLRFANGIQVGIHKTYLRLTSKFTMRELELEMMAENSSIYRFLGTKGIHVYEGIETLEAVPASETEARLLGVINKAPLLLVSRTTYTQQKIPVEYCKMVYRADRYRYKVHLAS